MRAQSRGRMNTIGTESIAAIERHSLEQLRRDDPISIFESCGSNGKS